MRVWTRRLTALGIAFGLIALTSRAEASGRRAVVRVVTPADNAILERIVGQTSDLAPELRPSSVPALERSMGARLEAARDLAARFDADLVVWFEHESADEMVVFVEFPRAQRVLFRGVGAAAGPAPASSSAGLEAAAFVVRTALMGLEADVALGVPDDALTETPPPAEKPARPPPARGTATATPEPPRRDRASALRPHAEVGWMLAADGQSPAGARAVVAELGLAKATWTAGVFGELGLPSRLHDQLASLEISRHAAGGLVTKTVMRGAALRLDAGLGGGVSVFSRAASRRVDSFSPTPSRTTVSVSGRAEVRLVWSARPGAATTLAVALGVEALSSVPVLVYSDGSRELRRSFWAVQPFLGFVVAFDPR